MTSYVAVGLTAPRWALRPTVAACEPRPEEADPLAAMVTAAQEGDRAAVNDLLEWLRPVVVRYCRARIGHGVSSYQSADDAAQEVCLAVLTALGTYRSQGRSFLGFVYGIAAHKVSDFHRKRMRDRMISVGELPDSAEVAPGPEEWCLKNESAVKLGELMGELTPMQREVLTLRVVVGLSTAETAEALAASPGAVRVCHHRALNRLRARLTAAS